MWNNIEHITEIIKKSFNKTDILNKLGLKSNGGNYNTLTSFIRRNGIDISHFDFKKSTKKNRKKPIFKIDEILVENSEYRSSNHLKNRLYNEGLKERKCCICGQNEEWMGKKMSLILDHINGDRHNNKIDNLQIVCPNCNATLDTHCRGLNKKSDIKHDLKIKKCEKGCCLNKIKKNNKFCRQCYFESISVDPKITRSKKEYYLSRRKVERPTYEILLKEIEEFGYVGTGKKYNVSDNSVRKWKKMYEKHGIE